MEFDAPPCASRPPPVLRQPGPESERKRCIFEYSLKRSVRASITPPSEFHKNTQKCNASIGTAPLYWRKGRSIQEELPLFGVSSPLCGRKKGRVTDETEYGFPF